MEEVSALHEQSHLVATEAHARGEEARHVTSGARHGRRDRIEADAAGQIHLNGRFTSETQRFARQD